jgi:methylenetetrahydrofolate reductase (NADPH)
MRRRVPGVVIPDEIVERLRKTPAERKREEGKRICVEIIRQVREIEGVAGVHVMAYRQEELVAEIIEEAGLLPRPRRAGWAQTRASSQGQGRRSRIEAADESSQS